MRKGEEKRKKLGKTRRNFPWRVDQRQAEEPSAGRGLCIPLACLDRLMPKHTQAYDHKNLYSNRKAKYSEIRGNPKVEKV